MQFKQFFENTDIKTLEDRLAKLKSERDFVRSKEEGGLEHVDLTNEINKIRKKIKEIRNNKR